MSTQPTRLASALADRYRIERELGQGGMAAVYLAQDLKHDRKVALKVLKPELAAVLGAERFVVEIKTTASLQHPHILPLFDSGTADGFLFYVMPYIQGETLRTRLDRETQLGIDEAVKITSDVADALHYAHTQGVIHRDIKPENILLANGRPMVADFGIALAVSAAAGGRMTETGLSLGTPHYMSPEQATAEKELTARSDIYSLGSVLYEMLTGNPPHTGASAQQIIMKIVTEDAAPVTRLRKAVPPNVAAAVAKSLEKLPADRFGSAKAFADALGNPAFRFSGGVDMAGSARAPVGHRRGTRVRLAAALVAFVGVGVAGVWLGTRIRAAPVAAVGAMRFRIALPDDSAVAPLPVDLRSIALSPDGRSIVATGAGPGGVSQLYARGVAELEWKGIAGTLGAEAPFFSYDGEWIAFAASRTLRKVPVAGGRAVDLASVDDLVMANWGVGDRIVLSLGGRLATLPGTGGTPRLVPATDSVSLQLGQWDPIPLEDGVNALFVRNIGQAGSDIMVISLETGETAALGVRGRPIGVLDNQLVFVDAGGDLLAVRFDPRARRVVGDPIRLLSGDFSAPGARNRPPLALSRSGALVYIGGKTQRDLVLRDVAGSTRVLWSPITATSAPRFAPDGERIVVDNAREIWLLSRSPGVAPRRLTSDSANSRPEWSPDGRRVLYVSTLGGRNTLRIQPVDGAGEASILLELHDREIWQGVLSSDGKTIALRTGTQAGADIWYRAMEGDTTLHPLAATPFQEHSPQFSPDGRWVAYASGETGAMEVYVRTFSQGAAPIGISLGGGLEPAWSHDGRSLYYRSGRQLIRASLSTGSAISVGSREVVFDDYITSSLGTTYFDVSPSGREFLMTRTVSLDPHIVFVHRWIDELRARQAKQ
jgi:serine/threonine-protein kinase